MDYYLLLGIIIILSFVQSVLGIGLLVLGTPTLILMNYSFFETMAIILPSSIVINLVQTMDSEGDYTKFKKDFLKYCLPCVLLSLTVILYISEIINFKLIAGLMLLLSGLIRLWKSNTVMNKFIFTNSKKFQMFIGLMHGLTNMGGGFLALFASSIYKSKQTIRSGIAYGYLFMGLLQYSFLLIFVDNTFRKDVFMFVILSLASYYFLGKPFFRYISDIFFQRIITYIVVIYGFIIILNEFKYF
tara:strand:+ start:567 stop:1298 length:732 start_codon:yes stop_codon:yes gene_type:complete